MLAFHGSECSPPNGGLPVASEPTTPPMPLKKRTQGSSNPGCSGDSECSDGHYCGGRGPRKQCRECYDCAKMQRSYKVAYDGKACAHNQLECGECNAGYTEHGGACLPDEPIPPGLSHAVGGFNSLLQPDVEKKEETGKYASINPTTIIVSSVVTAIAMTIVGVGICKGVNSIPSASRTKRGGTVEGNEEEALTSYNNFTCNEPSAPPDEYGQQPPYLPGIKENNMMQSLYTKPCDRLINDKRQRALPFGNGGNGVGDWIVTDDDAVEVPDETDSNPNIPPQPQSSSTGANSGNANGSLHRQAARRSLPAQGHVSVHTPRGPTANALRGEILGGHPPFHQNGENVDPVLGRISIHFNAEIQFRNYTWQNEPPAAQNPPHMAVSAPASPSPSRIDETFPSLDIMPAYFNDSRDSGTGTDDEQHGRTVPSLSVSGSDLDDSMFDDADNTQGPTPVPQRAVAVDIQQPIQNNFANAIMLHPIVDFERQIEDDVNHHNMEVEE
ncbi:hypothetical protein Ocin01_05295 [Orchesella cincta]|uniref:Uncharacterized protein n=1 Tax=Orchesella cincta TaxID=48709 RepID=A0A1D2N822_ORCCI|nr:hypothetical protein Ocin01_05295 [Orchesella cincta]